MSFNPWIRDGKIGFWIRDKHPGSATLCLQYSNNLCVTVLKASQNLNSLPPFNLSQGENFLRMVQKLSKFLGLPGPDP